MSYNPNIVYKRIPDSDWGSILPLLTAYYGSDAPRYLPDSSIASAIGGYLNDELIAVLIGQVAIHFEPFVVLPGHEGEISLHLMSDRLEEIARMGGITCYHVMVQDSPKALAAAQKNGLERHDGLIPHSKLIRVTEGGN